MLYSTLWNYSTASRRLVFSRKNVSVLIRKMTVLDWRLLFLDQVKSLSVRTKINTLHIAERSFCGREHTQYYSMSPTRFISVKSIASTFFIFLQMKMKLKDEAQLWKNIWLKFWHVVGYSRGMNSRSCWSVLILWILCRTSSKWTYKKQVSPTHGILLNEFIHGGVPCNSEI